MIDKICFMLPTTRTKKYEKDRKNNNNKIPRKDEGDYDDDEKTE